MVIVQQRPSNALGMAGFITSIIAFLTCGLLAPISLFLSLIGLCFRPRGYAMAGFLISGVSIVVLVVCWGLFLSALIVGTGALDMFQDVKQVSAISHDVHRFYEANQRMPNESEFADLAANSEIKSRIVFVQAEGQTLTFRVNPVDGSGDGLKWTVDASKPFGSEGAIKATSN